MSVEKRQEADLSPEVDALEPKAESLAKTGKLAEALEEALTIEKKARNAADLSSTTRCLLLILHLLRTTPSVTTPSWDQLNETIVSLSKKHGQLKQATAKMVGAAMCYLHTPGVGESGRLEEEEKKAGEGDTKEVEMKDARTDGSKTEKKEDKEKHGEASSTAKDEKRKKMQEALDVEDKGEGKEHEGVRKWMNKAKEIGNQGVTEEMKLKLLETIRHVTEGKIFVEVARARSTLLLARILESKGKISEAADALGDLAIETFGSMERREKHEIILEQMRLYMLRSDWSRMGIVARKINTKFFDDEKQHDLKLQFYELMIRLALNSGKSLDVCKHYHEIYNTPSVREDTVKAAETLRNIVMFLILSPYDNEQSDLMARTEKIEALDKVPEHKNLLRCFTTPELMRWPGIEALYNPILRATATFDSSKEGNERWEELHKRVVEHNIRVVSKYYTKITLPRLSQLLDLPQDAAESSLSSLVSNATVHAKIDRPAGVVNFEKKKDTAEHLNAWSMDMGQLLNLVEDTSHLIAREHAISRAGLVGKE